MTEFLHLEFSFRMGASFRFRRNPCAGNEICKLSEARDEISLALIGQFKPIPLFDCQLIICLELLQRHELSPSRDGFLPSSYEYKLFQDGKTNRPRKCSNNPPISSLTKN